mgnify:CR=1 FL=1
MKLPFFNRKRYLDIKCYTDVQFHIDECPITLSSKLPAMKPCRDVAKYDVSFRTCYGDIAGMKRSLAVPSWTEMDFKCVSEKEGAFYRYADTCQGNSKIEPHNDPYYQPRSGTIVKIGSPWMIEEKTGVEFVVAKHIRNMTPMAIPSGITRYDKIHVVNIFNLLPNRPFEYRVPFKKPLVALYPMSDLPMHVECIYDPAMRTRLADKCLNYGHFTANLLKLTKNKY